MTDATPSPHFTILGSPGTARIPMVVHVPHSGLAIPADVATTLRLTPEELDAELLAMTDRYTDELFEGVQALGGVAFANRLSRLVVDPERFLDPEREEMEGCGMGAVYTKTSDGRVLRTPDATERSRLIGAYFEPYTLSLEHCVGEMLERFGRCVIIDAHSFPRVPLPYERDQDPDRPQICIGTDGFHTPPDLQACVEHVCSEAGYRFDVNRPFSGSYVPLRWFGYERRVTSLMVEIRRDLYMDERTRERGPAFSVVQAFAQRVMEGVLAL